MKTPTTIFIAILFASISVFISCKPNKDKDKDQNIFGIYEGNEYFSSRFYLYPDSTYLFSDGSLEIQNSEFGDVKASREYDLKSPDDKGRFTVGSDNVLTTISTRNRENRYLLEGKSFRRNIGFGYEKKWLTYSKIGDSSSLPLKSAGN